MGSLQELEQIPEVTISQTGKQFMEDQLMLETAIQRIEDLRKEVERLNEVALKRSIEFENMKSKLETSNMHLFKFLDEIEGAFDVSCEFSSPEACIEYIDAALYARNYFFRNDLGRIDAAREWYYHYKI